MIAVDMNSVMVTQDEKMLNTNMDECTEVMELKSPGSMNDVVPLLIACANGEDEEIKSLLCAKKRRVNQAWTGGWSLLHVAVVSGFYNEEVSEKSVKCTNVLLERGHWPAYRNDQGLTPLHLLCLHSCYNNEGLKEEMLHYNNTGKGRRKMSSVIEDLAKLLLDAGGKGVMDAADSSGWTPLDAAVWANNSVMCNVLLNAGANVSSAHTYMAKSWIVRYSNKSVERNDHTVSVGLSPRTWRRKKSSTSFLANNKKGKKDKVQSPRFFKQELPSSYASCDGLVELSCSKSDNPAMLEASKRFGLAIEGLIGEHSHNVTVRAG